MRSEDPITVHEWSCTAAVDGQERVDLIERFNDYADTLENLIRETRHLAIDASTMQEFTTLSILSGIIVDALECKAAFIVISNI